MDSVQDPHHHPDHRNHTVSVEKEYCPGQPVGSIATGFCAGYDLDVHRGSGCQTSCILFQCRLLDGTPFIAHVFVTPQANGET